MLFALLGFMIWVHSCCKSQPAWSLLARSGCLGKGTSGCPGLNVALMELQVPWGLAVIVNQLQPGQARKLCGRLPGWLQSLTAPFAPHPLPLSLPLFSLKRCPLFIFPRPHPTPISGPNLISYCDLCWILLNAVSFLHFRTGRSDVVPIWNLGPGEAVPLSSCSGVPLPPLWGRPCWKMKDSQSRAEAAHQPSAAQIS